jgi:hypothetical protein
VEGQLSLPPPQTNGAQLGVPGVPTSWVQVPSALAPFAAVQASQAPEQAWSQQT